MANKYNHTTTNQELVSAFSQQIAGKTILVTGVTIGGLGHQFLKEIMVADPATFILAGRTPSKLQSSVDEITTAKPNINVKTLKLDLASFESVRDAAEEVNSWTDVPCIDVVVNNAGIMCPPHAATEDGIESQFQANHLGHFLLTNLIMNKILASSSPRVVSVSSNGARFGPIRWHDVNFGDGKYYDPMKAYAQSKTANILFAIGLAQRLGKRGLHSFSVHPGVVLGTALAVNSYTTPDHFLVDLAEAENEYGTKFVNGNLPQKEFKDGTNSVATHILTAFSPDIATPELNGEYFLDARVADPYEDENFAWTMSKIDAERLWKLSEKMIGQEFNY